MSAYIDNSIAQELAEKMVEKIDRIERELEEINDMARSVRDETYKVRCELVELKMQLWPVGILADVILGLIATGIVVYVINALFS